MGVLDVKLDPQRNTEPSGVVGVPPISQSRMGVLDKKQHPQNIEPKVLAYVPPQRRRCEKEYLPAFDKQVFALFAECFPTWILSIELIFCETVWIVGFKDMELFEEHLVAIEAPLELWRRAIEYLGCGRVKFTLVKPLVSLTLVSGSYDYLKLHVSRHGTDPAVLLVDRHNRRQRKFPKLDQVRWVGLEHVKFGGGSSYRCAVGYLRLPGFAPRYSALKRHVADFIDYGHECFVFKKVEGSVDSTKAVLDPTKLTQVFEHETHRSWTRKAYRPLIPDEIGLLLGLPERYRKGGLTLDLFCFVPVQIMDGVLQHLVIASRKRTEMAKSVTPRVIPARLDRTWLDSISRWLPHRWINEDVITDKAAKGDDAGVCVSLWDQRIVLPLPGTAAMIPRLRFALVAVATRRMYLETCCFLRETHGVDWLARYTVLRQRFYHEISCHLGGDFVSKSFVRSPGGEDQDEVKMLSLASVLEPFSFPFHVDRSRKLDPVDLANFELWHDVRGVAESMRAMGGSSWWSWESGSRLFFWRWPAGEQRIAARDGMRVYFKAGPRTTFQRAARAPKKEDGPKIFEKIHKFLLRGYMSLPPSRSGIRSLVEFFAVKKGDDDIRCVFNGTGCGLNATLFAPNFWLPTARSATDKLDFGYSSVDLDLGEMFPNFPLPMELRQYSGIDLTPFRELLVKKAPELLRGSQISDSRIWARWERNWMGMKPSPEMSVKFYYWAEEFVRGNRLDFKNALRWDRVRLNLPGSVDYDPSLPRVMKWLNNLNRLANDVVTFVDDCRATGFDAEEAWQVARQLASRLQYLGIQDAPRKRRPPSQDPGAWAGGIFGSSTEKITRTVAQSKWTKGKSQLCEILDSEREASLEKKVWSLNYKRLEQIRGFFVHLCMSYPSMIPYLKGMHMTLCVHLAKRDSEGWKQSDKEWLAYVSHLQEKGDFTPEEAHEALNPIAFEDTPTPHHAKPVPRFIKDVKVLQEMMRAEEPPLVLVRSNHVWYVIYGFADASGSGFGSSFLMPDGTSVRVGTWGSDEGENSSNWREFENAVDGLEVEAGLGNLDGCVVYLATDNSTVEACSSSGTSTSPKLHSLVIRLRTMELATGCHLVIFHVSGERMKAQGTDGFSRGSLKEGVAAGSSMLSFIPLHLSALERHPPVEAWFIDWMDTTLKGWRGVEPEVLTPEGWFERGHDLIGGDSDQKGFWRPRVQKGRFLWVPPPGAAENALEELRKSRLKRQDSLHVIGIPRLLGPEWRRLIHKTCDIVFELPPGHVCWPKGMFEPLIIGVCFPFILSEPWQLKGTPKMFAMDRKLRRLLSKEKMDGRCILRKFLLESERLSTVPRDVFHIDTTDYKQKAGDEGYNVEDVARLEKAWGNKHQSPEAYLRARNGDHAMVPFECDTCVFRKLKKRDPSSGQNANRDGILLACIRRMNLDAFWSRAESTVNGNAGRLRLGFELSALGGLKGSCNHEGPLPHDDHCGYEIAFQMLMHSRRPGRNDPTHTQWETIRHTKTASANQARASPQATRESLALGDQKGHYVRFSNDPCGSFWFSRFAQGCSQRMGQVWKPNRAMSVKLYHAVLAEVEDRIKGATDLKDLNSWVVFHSYGVVSYVVSLRGTEGLLLDLGMLLLHWGKKPGRVVIPLLGKIKGEGNDRSHLLPCVPVTDSGVRVKDSLERLIVLKKRRGLVDGPAISREDGRALSSRDIDDLLHEVLEGLFQTDRDLFPLTITSPEELRKAYQAFRTFRRTSDTRALEVGVRRTDIDVVNRWNTSSASDQPSSQMRLRYAQFEELLGPFLRYTQAM